MKLLEKIGEPDLKFGQFVLWVHGREFDELYDYWDGNWLRVTAHCGAEGAAVTISGTFVRITELVKWAEECRDLLEGRSKVAELPTLEPNLQLEMRMDDLGHITTKVQISPDHVNQQHTFTFELDQSYLPGLIRTISEIEERFPVRGVLEGAV